MNLSKKDIHDIRCTLGIIAMSCEVLGQHLPKHAQAFLVLIETNVKKLLSIFNETEERTK